MPSWANGSCPATATKKENVSSKKKKKQARQVSILPEGAKKKPDHSTTYYYYYPPTPPPTSRPHPPRNPLLMPLIPPPNPAPPIIKSHILPLNPNPPRLTNPPLILYNLMSAHRQIQRKTTLHNPPQNTTFAQNFPIDQSLLIPRHFFFHHCQFGCGEEVRFGNDDERRLVRGGFVFEM